MNWPHAVLALVKSRAHGKCEYCLIDPADAVLPHEIDHVISRKHGGTADPGNLAFACYLCNRYNGSDIASIHAETGELVRLFHPRQDRWSDHFRVSGPVLEPLTTTGMATSRLLRLNVADRVTERRLLQRLNRYPRE